MKKQYTADELIDIVLRSFEAERTNDVKTGRELITDDFKQRSMIIYADGVFPVFSGGQAPANLEDAYKVDGREFHVWNAAANEETQTVFIELVEVEPKDGVKRVWPYVLVAKIEDGKIKRSRHYGDPATLKVGVTVEQVQKAVED